MGSFTKDPRWSRQHIEMRTLALILLSSLLCSCYAQGSIFKPPKGQRCRGRNFDGKRCCTPEKPCGLGEGDCDGPLDGGVNDGHRGCQGDLVCGSNNCKKFGSYYHEKDDCCDLPQNLPRPEAPVIVPGTPLTPPPGQRCRGRNYDGRRCCTPENPCGEGEGDCDGAGDGGVNDGNRGCQAGLVCGSNNCKKFGAYYHEKDDCCERPTGGSGGYPARSSDWAPWSGWKCIGPGTLQREQKCRKRECSLNNGRKGTRNTQQRYSDTECYNY